MYARYCESLLKQEKTSETVKSMQDQIFKLSKVVDMESVSLKALRGKV